MNVDYFGLFQMFLLVCGGSLGIYHLRKDRSEFGRFLAIMCGVVIVMLFIITGLYLKINSNI